MSGAVCRVPRAGCRVPGAECRVPRAECRVLGAWCLVLVILAACAQPHAPAPPPAPGTVAPGTSSLAPGTSAPALTLQPHVTFPDGARIWVEVAADDPSREQGLMYRDRMAADRGMIFVFAANGDYPFWMKNTLIPLDMIWIDDQQRIAHIASDVPPCKADPCPNVPPNATARYVLETNAGIAAKHHLKNGDVLKISGLENVTVR